jgi:hypothetical protein
VTEHSREREERSIAELLFFDSSHMLIGHLRIIHRADWLFPGERGKHGLSPRETIPRAFPGNIRKDGEMTNCTEYCPDTGETSSGNQCQGKDSPGISQKLIYDRDKMARSCPKAGERWPDESKK